ncbi:paralemmin-1-like [Chaetodon trifascialis]|uniref:paralemmin-1-like n=1 Tax=Chaetodon trifascialis TaxID=109706 RepID=UPI003993B338
MDEADEYQQRLQAIAERRRQQEEEKKQRREAEEEWLKTAQEKRKYLREQWLSETAPAPVLPPLEPPSQEDEHIAAQKTPEDDEEEAADARKEEQASQENKESVHCTATARALYQAGADKDEQVNKEAEDHFSTQMAQRMLHESGQDGRSVLGTLAVQVERDPRTGATVIRSVAPLSTPAGAPMTTAVFDDGRKSIHAVGGVGGQPSTEELGQILSVIDGVGMKVLLDEVTVTPNKAETKTEDADASRAPEGKVLSFSTHHSISEEDNKQFDSSRSHDLETELGIEDCAVSMGKEEDKKEDRGITVVRDIAGEVGNVKDQSLEEGPVTLLFLGYTDSTTEQGHGEDEDEGMLTVERVMITEDGEELVLGPEASASPQTGKESQDQVFQDIPLEGNVEAGVKVQGEEGDKGLHNSSLPSAAEGGSTSKRKTCQCCSVM